MIRPRSALHNWLAWSRRSLLVRLAALAFAAVTIFQLLPHATKVLLLSEQMTASCTAVDNSTPHAGDASCALRTDGVRIPNTVHFVFILADPTNGTFPFQFSHFLSVYGASRRWKPDTVYLHTNVAADSDAVRRAKAGEAGKWAQRLLATTNLVVNTVEVPTHTTSGREITRMEHKSDFVRVQAVHDFGGIYIDMDVHPLRDVQPLRDAGYSAVAGKQGDGMLNSGTFMAAKGSKTTAAWIEKMHSVYDGRWTTHSNEALSALSGGVKKTPCELLVLEPAAFAPVGWRKYEMERLWGDHFPATEVDVVKHGGMLSEDDHRDGLSGLRWTRDWSCTYLLHAFSSKKLRNGVRDNGISPRQVAQRRSLFARAVYPMLTSMYEEGLVEDHDLEGEK